MFIWETIFQLARQWILENCEVHLSWNQRNTMYPRILKLSHGTDSVEQNYTRIEIIYKYHSNDAGVQDADIEEKFAFFCMLRDDRSYNR